MPVPHRGMNPTGANGPYNDMSGAPVVSGSAVQDAADPYAKQHQAGPWNLYPGWQQEETASAASEWRRNNTDYVDNMMRSGLSDQEASWYGRRAHHEGPTANNHVVRINDRAERTIWADEGPLSVDPTPTQDGAITNEPNNFSGRWSVANYGRILRAGVGYLFLRDWTDNERDEQGFSGDHISMSDNAVVLPIGGMRPNYERNKRNTYRIEPEPWDLNLVDISNDPTQNVSSPAAPQVSPNVGGGNSYRLG